MAAKIDELKRQKLAQFTSSEILFLLVAIHLFFIKTTTTMELYTRKSSYMYNQNRKEN